MNNGLNGRYDKYRDRDPNLSCAEKMNRPLMYRQQEKQLKITALNR